MSPNPQEQKIVMAMIGTIMLFLWNFAVWNALAIATAKKPQWYALIGIDVLVAMVYLSFYCIIC